MIFLPTRGWHLWRKEVPTSERWGYEQGWGSYLREGRILGGRRVVDGGGRRKELEEGGEWAGEGGELAKDACRREAGGAGWVEEGRGSARSEMEGGRRCRRVKLGCGGWMMGRRWVGEGGEG